MKKWIERELGAIEAAAQRIRSLTAEAENRDPLEIALRLKEARRERDDLFPSGLFGDPAWDLLVEAFIATEQQRPHGRNSLIKAAGLAEATGARWIDKLEEMGLLTHHPVPGMKRRRLYVLTGKGARAMTRALEQLGASLGN